MPAEGGRIHKTSANHTAEYHSALNKEGSPDTHHDVDARCWVTEARHGGHRAWPCLPEVSGTRKSIETGIGVVAAGGWEGGRRLRGTGFPSGERELF